MGTALFTSKDEARGYLAAMIDGEGHVAFQKRTRAGRSSGYNRAVSIFNTDYSLIEATVEACALLGIATRVRERTLPPPRKNVWVVSIATREALEALLDVPLRSPLKRAALVAGVASYAPRCVRPSRELLEQLYVFEQRPIKEIGALLGFAPNSLYNWLRKYGIEPRTTSEASALGHQRRDSAASAAALAERRARDSSGRWAP